LSKVHPNDADTDYIDDCASIVLHSPLASDSSADSFHVAIGSSWALPLLAGPFAPLWLSSESSACVSTR